MLRRRLALTLLGMFLLCPRAYAEWLPEYIVARPPLDGKVTSLVFSPDQKTLFALTSADGKPKEGEQYGLHIFDAAKATQLKQISFIPLASITKLYLSKDAKTVFALASWFVGYPKDGRYGLYAIDVSDRSAPKVISTYQADAVVLYVTQDRKTALIPLRREDSVHIVDLTDPAHLRKLTELPRVDRFTHPRIYQLSASDDGRVIAVDSIGRVWEFDLSTRSAPSVLGQVKAKSHVRLIEADAGAVYAYGSGKFHIYMRQGEQLTVSKSFDLPLEFRTIKYDADARAFVGLEWKKFLLFQVTDHGLEEKDEREFLASNYVSEVASKSHGRYLYVGVLGGIDVIDTSIKLQSNLAKMKSAHHDALALYREPGNMVDQLRNRKEAIRTLENAGIKEILASKPPDFPKAFYAHLLNDYAFFLLEDYKAKDSIPILRKVIQTDPKRGVAYLNLGDALRTQLREIGTYNSKRERSGEIVALYKKYEELTGKTTESVKDFLAYNLTNAQPANVCEYVAEYANRGRLREITTDIGHLDTNAQFIGGGTMHMPSVIVRGVELGGRAENIDVVPYPTGNYVLHEWQNGYLVALTTISTSGERDVCRFAYGNRQSLRTGQEVPVCQAIERGDRLEYVAFDKGHGIPRGVVGPPGQGAALVDIDNDGKTEPVVTVGYSSGAGRGCDRKQLAVLTPNRAEFAKSNPITKNLDKFQFQSSCLGTEFQPLIFQNETYIEGKTSLWGSYLPYHKVFQIKGGEVRELCDFEFKPINEYTGPLP